MTGLEEAWDKLSDGGTVTTPFKKQMWGDLYGMCIDQVRHPVDGRHRPAAVTRPQQGRANPGRLVTPAAGLVERSSRYAILLYLPGRHTTEAVRDAGGGPAGQSRAQSGRWDQAER